MNVRIVLAVLPVLFQGQLAAQTSGLLVSSYNTDAVHRFDETTFAVQGSLGGLGAVPGAQSLRYGPDGNLYACAEKVNRVVRFDGQTGAPLGALVADDPLTPIDETGGLSGPTAAVFGPDGALYVASFNTDAVLRYDGSTGLFLGAFVSDDPLTPIDETGGLSGPDAGMLFGPDGHLYVPSFSSDAILRYDGATGALIDAFVPPLGGGLKRPRMLRFHTDGRLWVTAWSVNRILRYDLDGTFLDIFATVVRPTGLVFRPDSGDVLVTSDNTNTVRQFDVKTGASEGTVITAAGGGLVGGTYLEYLPDRELRHARLAPGIVGLPSQLGVSGATPNGSVLLLYGTASAPLFVGACGHTWIGVKDPLVLPLAVDGTGGLAASVTLPPVLVGLKLVTQFLEPATCRTSNIGVTTLQ